MNRVFVQGMGAVSPAGWGVRALQRAVAQGEPLPTQPLARPGWPRPLPVRAVPRPPQRPAFASHPRLRRAGPISQHTVAAALEAIPQPSGATVPEAGAPASLPSGLDRGALPGRFLGVIVCVMAGGISYSRRFFSEVLENPGTASPMVFPETVFNAPASHLAALLGATGESATLVGDDGAFLQGLALAADWLARGAVERCVVVGAEELDWLVSDAMRLFSRRVIHAEGAGALCLGLEPPAGRAPELERVTNAHAYTARLPRLEAARHMRAELPPEGPGELLVVGTEGLAADLIESGVWVDWHGPVIAPKTVLGCAFNASAAWQCVLACAALENGSFTAANASVVGANQQAIGARFRACPDTPRATGSRPETRATTS